MDEKPKNGRWALDLLIRLGPWVVTVIVAAYALGFGRGGDPAEVSDLRKQTERHAIVIEVLRDNYQQLLIMQTRVVTQLAAMADQLRRLEARGLAP